MSAQYDNLRKHFYTLDADGKKTFIDKLGGMAKDCPHYKGFMGECVQKYEEAVQGDSISQSDYDELLGIGNNTIAPQIEANQGDSFRTSVRVESEDDLDVGNNASTSTPKAKERISLKAFVACLVVIVGVCICSSVLLFSSLNSNDNQQSAPLLSNSLESEPTEHSKSSEMSYPAPNEPADEFDTEYSLIDSIVGFWEYDNRENHGGICGVEFTEDGKMSFLGGTYRQENDGTYEIDNKALILTYSKGDTQVVYENIQISGDILYFVENGEPYKRVSAINKERWERDKMCKGKNDTCKNRWITPWNPYCHSCKPSNSSGSSSRNPNSNWMDDAMTPEQWRDLERRWEQAGGN